MNLKRLTVTALAPALLAILVIAGLSGLAGTQSAVPAQAAPQAQATPSLVTIFSSQVLTQDTRSNAVDLGQYDRADVEVNIVQGGTVNTATVRMDKSVSGYNWANGTTLLNASAISTTVVATHTAVGRYGSVYVDLANSQPVTLTVSAWRR